jgi:ABC-2 type transport system ATP-binding protein
VILSTHILAEVQAVCERIVIINHGRIIANERTEELTRVIEENTHFRYSICGASREILPALREVSGVVSAENTGERDGDATVYLVEAAKGIDIRKSVFRLAAERGWAIIGIAPVGADLETIFIRLVDRANGVTEPKKKRK